MLRKPSLFVLFGSLVVVTFAPRCSNGTQDCTQTSTCPSDASDGPGPLSCDTTKDPKDAPGCLDDRVGVFVDSILGKDTNPGTKAAPFQTIGKALSSTGTLSRVYVCEGTYAEDIAIAAPIDGISIYGGFKCSDWSYTGNKPTIGKSNIALKISGTTKPFAIEDVLVKAADGSAQSTSSIAALVANASGAITFTRVNLTAGVGALGLDGTPGSNYSATLSQSDASIAGHNASGVSGGAPQTCTGLCSDATASAGGGGGNGGTGSGGSGGLPNLGGTAPNDGAPGSGGNSCTNGNHGASASAASDAISPTTLGALTDTGWAPTKGAPGQNGGVGQGGGGGGGAAANNAGGGAGGGCGGCGGAGGLGGTGGGASIALAVVSSSVSVNASELHAGNAGDGGKGSIGQGGQQGGYSGLQSNPGCVGGTGGTGGTGGASAGGAGGISVGVLYKGSQPTLDPTTTTGTTVGKAGAKGVGGKPGTNDGIDGMAQPSLAAP